MGNATYRIISQDSIEVRASTSGTYRSAKFMLNVPDGTYTFSVGSIINSNTSFTGNRIEVSYYIGNTRTIVNTFNPGTARTITITNSPGKQYVLEFWATLGDSILNTSVFNNIQVEKGTAKTTFESYQSETYNINLGNIELCGIKGAHDSIYNDGENWYLYKMVGKTILNGSENYIYLNVNSNNYMFRTDNNSFPSLINNTINYTTDYFITNNAGYSSSTVGSYVYDKTIRFRIPSSQLSTTNTAGFQNWLSSHNTTIYYILSTPVITQITDENLINQLKILNHNLLFSGVAKRTGNISLNPFHAPYCDLQILDYKTLLSEGDMLDFVIADKTVEEAIDMVIESVKDYGFIKGNINIPDNFKMGTYNTQEKTAYDVFQYISDITQTKWTTRVINQDTVAIDFYNPYDKAPVGTIDSTQQYFRDNNIIDIIIIC